MMIGAKDLAFPRINLLSWYLYMVGAAWTAVRHAGGRRGYGLDLLHAVQLAVVALQRRADDGRRRHRRLLVALDRAEFHRHACIGCGPPGMTWFRLPIFVWTIYATSFIFLLAVPVLAMALILVIVERMLHIGIFDPALGGDPLLFQHLFWFYSHPAVYIMILPGMGVVSEVIPCFARKQLYGYKFVAYSQLRHRLPGLLRLGAPHVRGRHLALRGDGLFQPELPGRRSLGDQGLQLDGHALQGLDLLRGADALRPGLRRACSPSAA